MCPARPQPAWARASPGTFTAERERIFTLLPTHYQHAARAPRPARARAGSAAAAAALRAAARPTHRPAAPSQPMWKARPDWPASLPHHASIGRGWPSLTLGQPWSFIWQGVGGPLGGGLVEPSWAVISPHRPQPPRRASLPPPRRRGRARRARRARAPLPAPPRAAARARRRGAPRRETAAAAPT